MADWTLANNFESGTDEVTISTANSASPNAFDSITVVAPVVVVFDTAEKAYGTYSARIEAAANQRGMFGWTHPLEANVYGHMYFKLGQSPASSNTTFINFSESYAGLPTNIRARIGVNTGRTISIRNTAGTVVATSTTALILNTWYRFDWFFTFDVAAGAFTFKIFSDIESDTPVETITRSAQALGGTVGSIAWGDPSGFGTYPRMWIDGVEVNNFAYPSHPAGATTINAGDTFTGTESASAVEVSRNIFTADTFAGISQTATGERSSTTADTRPAAVEATTRAVTLSVDQAGTFSDTISSSSRNAILTDTGSFSDFATATGQGASKSASDIGTSSESYSVSVSVSASDSVTVTDTAGVLRPISTSDAGHFAESASVMVSVSAGDTGHAADRTSGQRGSNVTDTGTAVETQSFFVTLFFDKVSSDSGHFTDSATSFVTLQPISVTDSGHFTEATSKLVLQEVYAQDSVHLTDIASTSASVVTEDSGSGTDDELTSAYVSAEEYVYLAEDEYTIVFSKTEIMYPVGIIKSGSSISITREGSSISKTRVPVGAGSISGVSSSATTREVY